MCTSSCFGLIPGTQGRQLSSREYQIKTTLDGFYRLTELIHADPPLVTTHEIPYLAPLEGYRSSTGEPLCETTVYESLLNNYVFPADAPLSMPPRVAFTLKSSSVKGGGPLMVYRYAEWLVTLGVEVTIYSDDRAPDWITLSSRFRHIPGEVERYTSIREPVVIVYSVLELPALLRYAATEGKRIYHFCQGIEDYQYIPPPDRELSVPVPIFDLLNRLPVGRIAVSPHIEAYYLRRYGQRTHTIVNGIDLGAFYPGPPRVTGRQLSVVMLGNPEIPLKGVAQALAALALLHQWMPEYESCLHVVCGEDLSGRFDSSFSAPGVSLSMHYRLSPDRIRALLHEADFYINASYYEGFGLPSLEAMACGLPVVQVDNHGLDGIAVDGENCVLAATQDPRDIAAAVRRLLSDPGLRSRIIRNGIDTSRKYSLAHQFAMFVDQFQDILGITFPVETVHAIEESLMTAPISPTGSTEDAALPDLPLFTVLVPTYNQAQYLPACLESLLAQTCSNWEAVIVNDGSTDATREVLGRYAARDRRLRVLHKENGGVATALNLALEQARGKWICWLSSDDMFEPDKLETHLKAFAAHPGIYCFHTGYNVFYEETGRLSAIQLPEDFIPPLEQQVIKFFEINYVNGISICVHRSVFERVGGFNTALRNGQDFDMWLRISSRYRFRHLERRTCITRVHPEQGSSISADMGIFDSARAGLDFLNSHRFGELFPALDLGRTDHGLQAIQAALRILINPQAYVNCSGFGSALLERMREWLAEPGQEVFVHYLEGEQFAAIVAGIHASDLPDPLKTSFDDFFHNLGKPFTYQAHDPLQMLEQHARFLESKPGRAEETRSLRHYLSRCGTVTESDAADNVPYWQKMQELGYFENHPLYGREHGGLELFGDEESFIRNYTPMTRDMKVVVIGCGYGRESALIAPHVGHVYGIDVSDLILDKARAFTASRGITNFTAVRADSWKSEIPPGIHLVYTMVVFQHLTRALVRDYIAGLATRLAPGGRFLCQFCESAHGSYNADLRTHEPNVSWTAAEIRDLVAEEGLVLQRLDSRNVSDDVVWHWAFFGH